MGRLHTNTYIRTPYTCVQVSESENAMGTAVNGVAFQFANQLQDDPVYPMNYTNEQVSTQVGTQVTPSYTAQAFLLNTLTNERSRWTCASATTSETAPRACTTITLSLHASTPTSSPRGAS